MSNYEAQHSSLAMPSCRLGLVTMSNLRRRLPDQHKVCNALYIPWGLAQLQDDGIFAVGTATLSVLSTAKMHVPCTMIN